MKTIIFVCHGSICRSPAAAFIAEQYLKEQGRDKEFNILIRATSSEEIGNDVYPPMKRELYRRGVTMYPHAAQRIRQVDYEGADYILVLDHGEIIERGNHESLIAEKGAYYQLYTGAVELE